MKLTPMLSQARAKYGDGVQLREMPDGARQVIAFHGPQWSGVRDASGVEVVAETRGPWREVLR